MSRARFILPLLSLLSLLLAAPAAGQRHRTEYEGASALGLELRRLGVAKRVLMIGAHPDDESTQVLSTLALGQGAEVAYLSLTRGEGGQNGIGPEMQEGLGLLRTEELLAARRLDGARQYFTRAYDYGFSKDADEAFRHWPRDSVLADVVAVVRHFRPDVVIAVFTGTPRDGHGQHQASGILAREAFAVAGDPERFPEQLAAGLRPFAPRKLYQGVWRQAEGPRAQLHTGEYDPLLGRSYFQVAMASRSRHRSQDMGQVQTPGPQTSTLTLVESRVGSGEAAIPLFAGVDTTLAGRVGGARGANGARSLAALLADYQRRVDRVVRGFNPLRPDSVAAGLARALRALDEAQRLAASAAPEDRDELAREREEVEAALWRALGAELDVVADDETVVPGQTFGLELTLWNGGGAPIRTAELAPVLPAGWTAEAADPLPAEVAPGTLVRRRWRVRVPDDARPTQPYFLLRPRVGDVYAWPDGVQVGLPFQDAPVAARARIQVDGVPVSERRDATFRELDKMQGEVRRPVRVVPAVSVLTEPGLAVVPIAAGGRPIRVAVRLRAEAPSGVAGTLRLRAPDGWRLEPAVLPVRFAGPEERVVEVTVTPPAAPAPGEIALQAVFEAEGGARYDRGYTLVSYPHTRPRELYRPATTRVRTLDVRLPQGLRVGYVAGAGDDTPEALRQMGVEVVTLSGADLASGDLAGFDAVVTGIRAYEVRPDLVAHNRRLLDYVSAGGTMVVLYNKYEYTEPGIAPYPVEMARPHDRVTDEGAPVRLLDPAHPALSWPNRIGPADFEGWVQERGLYFLRRWDPRFTPLLEMADPGEAPQQGSLLVARHGAGRYVYTGLAFFRQLPEGVPGAYRLFANLISLGAKR